MKEKTPTEYHKNCPKCNKIIYYKHPQTLDNSIRNNWDCRRCVLLEKRGLYTEQEEQFLIDNYFILGCKNCARELNRSEFSIGVKASKLKLKFGIPLKNPINNKRCARCHLELSKDKFGISNRNKDKRSCMCKICSQHDRQRPDKLENKKKYDFKYKEIKKKNPIFKLRVLVKKRIASAMKSSNLKKKHSTIKLLGCSIANLRSYLQAKFTDGMSWENHGIKGWHIDHIIPLASAKSQTELESLFHYTNLQPLWWYDNLSKKDKIL